MALQPEDARNDSKRNTTPTEKLSRPVPVQNPFMRYSKLGPFLAMMAEGRMDLFWQVVYNMLAALRMPDDDNKLYDLTFRIDVTGKL
jgi:hypothetical protein